ncbi:MAG TPA: hypothetical protein PKV13_14925 [Propionicimonas sp.]|nr:hypothetical protein [Propionicimonas sp.]
MREQDLWAGSPQGAKTSELSAALAHFSYYDQEQSQDADHQGKACSGG